MGRAHISNDYTWLQVCSQHNYAKSRGINLVINEGAEPQALCLPLPSDRFECPHVACSARNGFQAHTTGQLYGTSEVLTYGQKSPKFAC